MQDLITISKSLIGKDDKVTVPTVDARELWTWLESKQDFSTWIKKRLSHGFFIDDVDYCSTIKKVARTIGGSTRTDYTITTYMAKHIAMMEQTERGHKARHYFIKMEQEARRLMNFTGIAAELREWTESAMYCGSTRAEALVHANEMMKQTRGFSVLEHLGVEPHTISTTKPLPLDTYESEDGYFTPQQLTARLNISIAKFNQLLIDAHLQRKTCAYERSGNFGKPAPKYLPLQSDFFDLQDLKDLNGNDITILRWKDAVLDEIGDRTSTRSIAVPPQGSEAVAEDAYARKFRTNK